MKTIMLAGALAFAAGGTAMAQTLPKMPTTVSCADFGKMDAASQSATATYISGYMAGASDSLSGLTPAGSTKTAPPPGGTSATTSAIPAMSASQLKAGCQAAPSSTLADLIPAYGAGGPGMAAPGTTSAGTVSAGGGGVAMPTPAQTGTAPSTATTPLGINSATGISTIPGTTENGTPISPGTSSAVNSQVPGISTNPNAGTTTIPGTVSTMPVVPGPTTTTGAGSSTAVTPGSTPGASSATTPGSTSSTGGTGAAGGAAGGGL